MIPASDLYDRCKRFLTCTIRGRAAAGFALFWSGSFVTTCSSGLLNSSAILRRALSQSKSNTLLPRVVHSVIPPQHRFAPNKNSWAKRRLHIHWQEKRSAEKLGRILSWDAHVEGCWPRIIFRHQAN